MARWGSNLEKPRVVMTGFADNAVTWEVRVWMNDPWEYRPAESDLYQSVWWALKESKIAIAFPQLDIHLDSAALAALGPRALGLERQSPK